MKPNVSGTKLLIILFMYYVQQPFCKFHPNLGSQITKVNKQTKKKRLKGE